MLGLRGFFSGYAQVFCIEFFYGRHGVDMGISMWYIIRLWQWFGCLPVGTCKKMAAERAIAPSAAAALSVAYAFRNEPLFLFDVLHRAA